MSIKVSHAALDEFSDSIILRGVIDASSLKDLRVDDYQREVEPLATLQELVKALKTSTVPDVELGMRGHHVLERDDSYYLQDPVFIVDGLQRVSAGLEMLKIADGLPRIGCVVHFGTNKRWERERFDVLNSRQKRLSPNVLLRNMREDNAALATLYNMTENDGNFVLRHRVSWSQRQQRKQLITAMTLLKVAGHLHAHVGPGRGSNRETLSRGAEEIMSKLGRNIYRENIRNFFDLLDINWGVRRVVYRAGATYLKENFMLTMATVLSRHAAFWRGDQLHVEPSLMRKIGSFPVSDPYVSQLSGSGSTARIVLYQMIMEHINSGKRTKRLKARDYQEELDEPLEDSNGNGHDDAQE